MDLISIDLFFLVITWGIFLAVSRNVKLTIFVLVVATSICIIFNLDMFYVVPISLFGKFFLEKVRKNK